METGTSDKVHRGGFAGRENLNGSRAQNRLGMCLKQRQTTNAHSVDKTTTKLHPLHAFQLRQVGFPRILILLKQQVFPTAKRAAAWIVTGQPGYLTLKPNEVSARIIACREPVRVRKARRIIRRTGADLVEEVFASEAHGNSF
jgi:hypothetical protein